MADILFSPVGKTDPISHERDGSMLHICRRYRPEYVMLYLSKGMLAYQERDDRYRACLRRLAEAEGFSMEILTEERPELDNVHLFDVFYQEFDTLLHQLHRTHPKHRILVNLSSGTPAMKSALEVLTTLLDFPVLGIQVSDPNQGQVSRREEPADFELEVYWACDLDCDPATYQDRTRVLKSENLRGKLHRQTLEAHLDAWDYRAAQQVGRQMGELLPPRAGRLLQAACLRSQQEWQKIDPNLQKQLLPDVGGYRERKIFEYLLGLDLRIKRGELADFLRGLTPALYALALYAVERREKIPLSSYCQAEKLSAALLRRDSVGKRILAILEARFNGPFNDGYVNSEHCCAILNACTQRSGKRFFA